MPEKIGQILIRKGKITPLQLRDVLRTQQFFGGYIGSHLINLRFVDEQALGETLSEIFRVPFAPYDSIRLARPAAIEKIPASVARRYRVIPIHVEEGRIHLAMLNPHDSSAISNISAMTGLTVVPWVAPEFRIVNALDKHYKIRRERGRPISDRSTPRPPAVPRGASMPRAREDPAESADEVAAGDQPGAGEAEEHLAARGAAGGAVERHADRSATRRAADGGAENGAADRAASELLEETPETVGQEVSAAEGGLGGGGIADSAAGGTAAESLLPSGEVADSVADRAAAERLGDTPAAESQEVHGAVGSLASGAVEDGTAAAARTERLVNTRAAESSAVGASARSVTGSTSGEELIDGARRESSAERTAEVQEWLHAQTAPLFDALSSAASVDDIARGVLGFMSTRFRRVAAFMVREDLATGWIAGPGLDPGRLAGLRVPLENSSVFSPAGQAPYTQSGATLETLQRREFYEGLGGDAPPSMLLIPIQLRQRIVAIFYADNRDEPLEGVNLDLWQRIARGCTLSLEIVILRGKLRSLATLG